MKLSLEVCAVLVIGAGALNALGAGADGSTSCMQGAATRTITIVYSIPGQPVPCEVLYDKPGEGPTLTLWRAENEAGYCETRAAEFVERLTNLGWDCSAAAAAAAPAATRE